MDHFTGGLDVTPWLAWFLACLLRAVQGADGLLAGVLEKAQFWQRWAGTPMNARQTLVLNYVLDGMEGKLTNAKWVAVGRCSADTALRDINDLVERGYCEGWRGVGGVWGMGYKKNKVFLSGSTPQVNASGVQCCFSRPAYPSGRTDAHTDGTLTLLDEAVI